MSRPQRRGAQRESAQDGAYRWLKHRIAALPRHEGTFLTEAEVCDATGTSRTPAREALLRLEAEGLLQIVPKKGAYVPPITDAQVEAVMQARALVEDWCVRRVAQLAAGVAPELDRLLAQQAELQDNPVAFIECDRQFHRAIVQHAGNPVLAGFYESLRDRQVRMGLYAIAASEQRTRAVLREHQSIVGGIRSGEQARAADAVAAHLAGTLAALHLPSAAHWAPRPSPTAGAERT